MAFENISKGEFYVDKNIGYGKDTHCVCIKDKSDKIKFPMRKPKAYYTEFVKGDDGGTILSTDLAIKSGNYVATEQIREEINKQEKENAEFIAYCFNLQQRYDISKLEEAVKLLESNFNLCDMLRFPTESELNDTKRKIEQLLKQIKK